MAFSAWVHRPMFVVFLVILVIAMASLMVLKFWSDQGLVSEGKLQSETSSEERTVQTSWTRQWRKRLRRWDWSERKFGKNSRCLRRRILLMQTSFLTFTKWRGGSNASRRDWEGETLFEDGDLASKLLVKRIWDDNRLMEKLKEARLKQIAGEDGECVIKVMAWCGGFCGPLSSKPVAEYTCRFSTCVIQYQVGQSFRLFENSDVVIFMPGSYKWDILLSKQPPGQIWAMQSKESPSHWHAFTPPREAGNPVQSLRDIYVG